MLAAYALGCLLMVFRACAYTPALVQTRVRRCMGHAMKGATPHVQRRHTLRMIDVSDPEDPSTRYFYSQKEFADIGASADMLAALPTLKLHKPSKIQVKLENGTYDRASHYIVQAIAYRPLLAGDHCIVADQTGSGKTLAYLLPLIQVSTPHDVYRAYDESALCPWALQRLKQQIKGHTISPAKPRQAYVLILAPTSGKESVLCYIVLLLCALQTSFARTSSMPDKSSCIELTLQIVKVARNLAQAGTLRRRIVARS
jgi:hypothetical protein